jgi:hypothetical protein
MLYFVLGGAEGDLTWLFSRRCLVLEDAWTGQGMWTGYGMEREY